LFRIFVSSTISDFALEREVLRQRVFLPMSERLLAQGFLLEVVDLRWGPLRELLLLRRLGVDEDRLRAFAEHIRHVESLT
jgi:hypothetical protein